MTTTLYSLEMPCNGLNLRILKGKGGGGEEIALRSGLNR